MADPVGFQLPSPADFDTFVELDDSADVSDWTSAQKVWLIRQAADLMLLATGMDDGAPVAVSDTPLGRMVFNGILDMAFYLGSSFDDRSAQQYSPFASERIGEYSYSKFITSITNKQGTGVTLFDNAVTYYLSKQSGNQDNGQFAHSSEDVFATNFKDYEREVRSDSHWYGGWR